MQCAGIQCRREESHTETTFVRMIYRHNGNGCAPHAYREEKIFVYTYVFTYILCILYSLKPNYLRM